MAKPVDAIKNDKEDQLAQVLNQINVNAADAAAIEENEAVFGDEAPKS